MIALHPKILEKDGEKEFAILPFNEFQQIKSELQDYEDLKALRDAKSKEQDIQGVSLSDAKTFWGI